MSNGDVYSCHMSFVNMVHDTLYDVDVEPLNLARHAGDLQEELLHNYHQ